MTALPRPSSTRRGARPIVSCAEAGVQRSGGAVQGADSPPRSAAARIAAALIGVAMGAGLMILWIVAAAFLTLRAGVAL